MKDAFLVRCHGDGSTAAFSGDVKVEALLDSGGATLMHLNVGGGSVNGADA